MEASSTFSYLSPTPPITGKTPPQPAIMPTEEIREFVAHHLSQREIYLGVLTDNSPPLYLLDTTILAKRADEFRNAFEKELPETSFFYAVKSNNHPLVSQALIGAGYGLDVSSGEELEMALSLDAQDIIFSGPGKTDRELSLAVENATRVTVLMDSFGELDRLGRISAEMGHEIRAGVRLNNNPQGLWRKFGIMPALLAEFWVKSRQHPNIKLQGLQFHSSWNLGPEKQVSFIAKLGQCLKDLPEEHRAAINFIDIGGGYWPPQGEWLLAEGADAGKVKTMPGMKENKRIRHKHSAATIDFFAAELAASLRKHIFNQINCRICFEPGRWICNDAMHLLFSIVDKKMSDLVVTDAGTNAVGWERFEVDYFPVINLTRPALTERSCQIVGSLCTPHDLWGDAYWGEDIQPGDMLMIPTQGAYTYSLRQEFIKPLPKVVTLNKK